MSRKLRFAHALAIAGLRERGAPLPPPNPGSLPLPPPWPEPPPHRERPVPALDGKAARDRAKREAMLIPALALLIGLALAQAASGGDSGRPMPEAISADPARIAPVALRRQASAGPGAQPPPPGALQVLQRERGRAAAPCSEGLLQQSGRSSGAWSFAAIARGALTAGWRDEA